MVDKYYSLIEIEKIKLSTGSIIKIFNNEKELKSIKEIYCSTINYSTIREWKKHKFMTLKILITSGKFKFVFPMNNFRRHEHIIMSSNENKLLIIKPGVWFSFIGLNKSKNSLINFSNILHDEDELLRKKIEKKYFDWF